MRIVLFSIVAQKLLTRVKQAGTSTGETKLIKRQNSCRELSIRIRRSETAISISMQYFCIQISTCLNESKWTAVSENVETTNKTEELAVIQVMCTGYYSEFQWSNDQSLILRWELRLLDTYDFRIKNLNSWFFIDWFVIHSSQFPRKPSSQHREILGLTLNNVQSNLKLEIRD